jgi:rhamnogalacturonan endolyase
LRLRTSILAITALCTGNASAQRQMETLNRGVIAVWSSTAQVYVGWRLFATDSPSIAFNLYRSIGGAPAVKLNANPISDTTNYVDGSANPSLSNAYFVKPVLHGRELPASETFTIPANTPVQQYLSIPLQIPPGGASTCNTQPSNSGDTSHGTSTSTYTYNANDGSIGDVDGDGQNELILKWDPTNSQDNANSGCTAPTILDAYKLDGTLLWRINLGRNIRSGAHYTQFQVWDYDGDGQAEVVVKTADGTIDGVGTVIGDGTKDYTSNAGYILAGPEYLTIFDGKTGAARLTTDYFPSRNPFTTANWGDSYGNRVDRFLAGTAYLDGVHPSIIRTRGYYQHTYLVAYDYRDGQLTRRWVFDSHDPNHPEYQVGGTYIYDDMGDHALSIADIDGDGRDEIIFGSLVLNHDGTPRCAIVGGHGDALHASRFSKTNPDVLVYTIHENLTPYPGGWAETLYNPRTCEVLTGLNQNYKNDPGRGMIAPFSDTYTGAYMWGGGLTGVYDLAGNHASTRSPASANFAIWWDADLQRELEDANAISKYDMATGATAPLLTCDSCLGNNGTKNTPVLLGDIFGDWREEVIWRTSDNASLRIYTTTIPATNRIPTLLQDPQYRLALAWQNSAYNQPPWPSFYLGPQMNAPPVPNIVTQASAGVTLTVTEVSSGATPNRHAVPASGVWTISITNAGPGIAQNVEINSATLTQALGAACHPVLLPAPPAYPAALPVVVGDLDAGASGTATLAFDLTGCPADSRFSLNVSISANGGPVATVEARRRRR